MTLVPASSAGSGGSLPAAPGKGAILAATGAGSAFGAVAAALAAGSDGSVPMWDSTQTAGLRSAPVPGNTVLYVSPNGNDARGGLSRRDALQTLSAAVAALPAEHGGNTGNGGGYIVLDDGDYDVYNSGLGLVLDRTKPTVLRAHSGNSRFAATDIGHLGEVPRIYSSGGAIANGLINMVSAAGLIESNGFWFDGLAFDLTDGTPYGINVTDCIYGRVTRCTAVGPSTQTVAQWLLGLQTVAWDASWWRISNNYANYAGLVDGGNTSYLAFNQNLIAKNICFYGAYGVGAIRLRGGSRCATYANNLEQILAGNSAILLDHCHRSSFVADAGEGVGVTFLKSTGGGSNVYAPIGMEAPNSGDLLIDASGDPQASLIVVSTVPAPYSYGQVKQPTGTPCPVVTAGGMLSPARSVSNTGAVATADDTLFISASSGAVTRTLPTAVGCVGKRFTAKKTDSSANAVTVATTSSQTIDGATTYSLGAQYKYVTVESDGANWQIVANN